MNNNETLGTYLKYKRMTNGFTQMAMAKKLGITEQYYCQIEKDKRKCGVELIKKIADVTGCKPKHIFELREKSTIK